MKKTFWVAILTIICTLCLVFGLAACAETDGPNAGTGSGGTEQGDEGGGSQTPAPQEFTVTFDANGGAFSDGQNTYTQTVTEGNQLTVPQSPARDHYTFAGWTRTQGGSDLWQFGSDTVTGNTTLYAKWQQASATLFSVEGASIEGTEVLLLVEPGTEEVNLTGGKVVCSEDSTWHLYRKGSESEIYTKTASALADGDNEFRIVVASKEGEKVNTYNFTVHRKYMVEVTYMANGEVYGEPKEVMTGSPLTEEEFNIECTVKGYTFNGWEHELEYGETILTPLTFTADLTVNTYRVTFDAAGGSDVSEKTVTFDQSYSFPSSSRTGYTFLGWWTEDIQLTDGSSSLLPLWNIDSDTEVTAHWQANNYTVTLNLSDRNAGTVSGGGDHPYDSQVTIIAYTTSGYNFLGWYDDIYGTLVSDQAKYTFTMGFAVSYTAKWDYYTLTATRNDENAGTFSQNYDRTKVSVGTEVTLTAITNLGYQFVGWYKGGDEVSTDPTYQYTMIKEDVSFEARWTLDPAMADFTFSSTSMTCTITRVKNTSKTEYVVPDYVTDIKQGAFCWCSSVQSITLPFVGGSVSKTSRDTYQYPFGYIFGTASFSGASAVSQTYYGNSTSKTTSTQYYIPNSLKNVILTGSELLYGAFYNCNSLTSITIPDRMTSIGESAFVGCSSLEAVYITDLEAWCGIDFGRSGANPLSYAKHLYVDGEEVTDLHIPDGITKIKQYAFDGGAFTSITIPEGVTSIGRYAFSSCSSLQSVTFEGDSQLTSIGESAFCGCSFSSITIPASVISIWSEAFRRCSSLQSVTFEGDSKLTSIGIYAFYDCDSLSSITIPASVTSIGDWAFSGCSSLNAVYITNLEAWCGIDFGGYYNANPLSCAHHLYVDGEEVTDLHIPDGVTEIKRYAFDGGAFTSITIPEGVTSIGSSAFYECYKLIEVWNDSALPLKEGDKGYGYVAYYAKHVYTVNEQSKQTVTDDGYIFYEDGDEVYLLGYTGNETSLTLPDTSPSGKDYQIYQYAFRGGAFKSVTIPESVTSIGSSAFDGCSSLEAVYITDLEAWCGIDFEVTVEVTGYYSYSANPLYYAHHLYLDGQEVTDLHIPDGVTEIKPYAFYGYTSLTSVTIPESVTSIGDYAFYYCSSLQSVTFDGDSQLTSIGKEAFEYCKSLESFTIPASVTEIGWNAFHWCSKLTNVIFKRTDGWTITQSSDEYAGAVTVSDPQTAAKYLRDTYSNYRWKRY